MLRALDRDPHLERLRELLRRFRAEELSLMTALLDCEELLAAAHDDGRDGAGESVKATRTRLQRCADLQAECDVISTELVHVRMAIAGAREELDQHAPPHRVAPKWRSDRLVSSA